MRLDLTIVIPVRNEESNLPGCLEAIGIEFCARVVVVDSGSSDSTREIAADWGAEIVMFQWDGKFPKKRNWFLRNHLPTTTWVLFLDADEYLTPEFKNELSDVLPSSEMAGYWLNYSIYFMGRLLKHGYPLQKLALFRTGAGEYERIDEERWSKLDMEVHEHPLLKGKVGNLSAKIDHRDFRGVEHYVSKHNDYSTWEAYRFLRAGGRGDQRGLTLKQRIKYRLALSPFIGVIYFFGTYVLMRGFLDGPQGLAFSILKMGYFTQVYCKIRELKDVAGIK